MNITQEGQKSESIYEVPVVKSSNKENILLAFEERDKDSVTACEFEFNASFFRLLRKGEVTLSQVHEMGRETEGMIRTAYGEIQTRVETFVYELEMLGDGLKLMMAYKLYVGDDEIGDYVLDVNLKER